MLDRCCRMSLLLLLVVAGPALAHVSLPSESWCSHGRLAPVGHFTFSAIQIQHYADCETTTACVVPATPGSAGSDTALTARGLAGRAVAPPEDCSQMLVPEPTASCGEFDDDYGVARGLTDAFCARFVRLPIGNHVADWGTVVPDVLNPTLFYDPDLHHNYSIYSGLDVMCLRCEDPVGVPTN
jgi:hypothetical protein